MGPPRLFEAPLSSDFMFHVPGSLYPFFMTTTAIIHERVRDVDLRLTTQAGVFAHKGLDLGTRLLIEAMHVTPTAKVLDIGCGYGAIGITAAKLATKGEVVLVDS